MMEILIVLALMWLPLALALLKMRGGKDGNET